MIRRQTVQKRITNFDQKYSRENEDDDKKSKFTFVDLFAGIGGIRMGFENVSCKCVFTSEWDKHAQKTYESNFGEIHHGDITKINPEEIPPFDILLAGFPCQPFSQAGLKKGFDDTRGTLFFDIARIIQRHKPRVIFLENVRNLAGHDKGKTLSVIVKTLEDLGYIVFFRDNIKFDFPKEPKIPTKVGQILNKNVDDIYTLSDKLWAGHQRRKREHALKGNEI